MSLVFDNTKYEIKSLAHNGINMIYRAFTHIPYVENPIAPDWQCLSIYVPEAYYEEGASINGYTLTTAPIFFPNAVGGYKPGKECEPEIWSKSFPMAPVPEALSLLYLVVPEIILTTSPI